jgi:eukaryotic-like serine/threonine-protein kinase
LEKGITALELYKQTYARDAIPYNNLAAVYNGLGQFENAVENARQAVQLDPDSVSGYSNLAQGYAGMNRLEEAKATLEQSLKRNLNLSGTHFQLAAVEWLQKDPVAMEKELDLAGKAGPDGQMDVLAFRSALAACQGRLNAARDFGEKARAAGHQLGLTEPAANEYLQEALIEASVSNKTRALSDVTEALKLSQSQGVTLNAAVALALAGDDAKATKLGETVAQKRPYDTLVQFVQLPIIKSQIQLNHGEAVKAIGPLDSALVYARTDTTALYVRGNAYLKAGKGPDAVQAFQRVLELKYVAALDPLLPLAHLGLARAYALADDKAQSRVAYQDFFALWKDADADIPALRQAKQEYAKLQ